MKKLFRLLGTVLLFLSCSTVTMAAPFLFEMPDPGDGESRYAFTWQGELDFADGSPFQKFDNQKFTLSGFYFSNGTFDFTRMDFVGLPDPDSGGSLVALPPPEGCRTGCLAMPNPDVGGGGSRISLIPLFEITTLPDGTRTALFRSLDFDGIAADFTISNHMYQAAPVPEPSTIHLFAAGLAGLTAIGRRKRTFVKQP